jgi:hypothetical protein
MVEDLDGHVGVGRGVGVPRERGRIVRAEHPDDRLKPASEIVSSRAAGGNSPFGMSAVGDWRSTPGVASASASPRRAWRRTAPERVSGARVPVSSLSSPSRRLAASTPAAGLLGQSGSPARDGAAAPDCLAPGQLLEALPGVGSDSRRGALRSGGWLISGPRQASGSRVRAWRRHGVEEQSPGSREPPRASRNCFGSARFRTAAPDPTDW